MRILTDLIDIHANSTSVPIFLPMTDPMSSTQVEKVRFAVWLAAVIALKMRPAVRFSNDGVTWDNPKEMNLAGAPNEFASGADWTFGDGTWHDIFTLSGVTPRLFCQFGALSLNVASSDVHTAQSRLRIDVEPIPDARSLTFAARRVFCKPNDTDWLVHDVSGPLPAERVKRLRATMEILGTTGSMTMKASFQTANKPDDPSD